MLQITNCISGLQEVKVLALKWSKLAPTQADMGIRREEA